MLHLCIDVLSVLTFQTADIQPSSGPTRTAVPGDRRRHASTPVSGRSVPDLHVQYSSCPRQMCSSNHHLSQTISTTRAT